MRTINFAVLLMIALAVASGCTTTKRGLISENVYSSARFPDIKIEVDSNFVYNEEEKHNFDYSFTGPGRKQFLGIAHITPMVLDNKLDYWNHPQHWIFSNIPQSSIHTTDEIQLLGKTWYSAIAYKRGKRGCFFQKHLRRFTNEESIFILYYAQWKREIICTTWEDSSTSDDRKGEIVDEFETSFTESVIMSLNEIN